MTHVKSFRSALNGFNREDVVHYIEYLNAKHNSQLQELNSELELARSMPASGDLAQQLKLAQEEAENLRRQLREKTAALEELQERYEDLQTSPQPAANTQADKEVQRLQHRCEELEQKLREAQDTASASHCSMEKELELYRRAERTEREARERAVKAEAEATRRAEQISDRANAALADASARVEETFSQITQLTTGVNDQLAQLQQAVTDSRQVLTDASQALYTISSNDTI